MCCCTAIFINFLTFFCCFLWSVLFSGVGLFLFWRKSVFSICCCFRMVEFINGAGLVCILWDFLIVLYELIVVSSLLIRLAAMRCGFVFGSVELFS